MTAARGQVVVKFGKQAFVRLADGRLLECALRKNCRDAVCGDDVEVSVVTDEQGVIERIEPRRTVFERPDKYRRIKALAANITQAIITVAPKPELIEGLLDNYIAVAEASGFTPAILVNKVDVLGAEPETSPFGRRLHYYQQLGYRTYFVSCRKHIGLAQLPALLAGQTSIVVGQSGVGKSSLIDRLLPEVDVRIGMLSERSGEGTHTTTATHMYWLDEHTRLIDSPGVRELRIHHLAPEQLRQGFIEFRAVQKDCRFANCVHINEPGCGVKLAVKEGRIAPFRYEHYRRMLDEIQAVSSERFR